MSDTATAVKDDAATTAPTAPAPADVATQTADEDLDSFALDPNDFKDTGEADKPKEEGTDKRGESDTKEADASKDDANTDDKPAEGTEDKDDAPDTTETEDNKPKGADARKEQLNSEIRDLVAKRNELRQEVAAANAKVYQPQSAEDLQQAGMDALEAKIEAMRQQQEMDRYNESVAEAQLVIENEAERVLRDFPIFNPDSKDSFNKPLYEAASELFNANVVKDENSGQVIGTHLSTYKLYKLINDAVQIGTASGQAKGARAVKKAIASADVVASSGPKSTKTKDKFESAFDKEFDKY